MIDPMVVVRQCTEYDQHKILKHIEWLYTEGKGPDPSGKKVLVKPNILSDVDPSRPVTTHPVVVEAVIKYLQSRGAQVFVGDSPSFDTDNFTGEMSGIRQAVERSGATWVRLNTKTVTRKVGNSSIKLTSLIEEADLIISVSKLKNHELMYFTGAMKNIYGLIPGFNKMILHAKHPDRNSLAEFLVDLEEAIRPDFHIMDGIVAMEGPGPANGYPKKVNLLLASVNPLALDIVASRAVGYDPLKIPINKAGLERGKLLKRIEDINVRGADPDQMLINDFNRIKTGGVAGIILKFLKDRFPVLRRLDKIPVFNSDRCISCAKCIEICPTHALGFDTRTVNSVLLNDLVCIRCYCCHEVCLDGAIEIKRKVFYSRSSWHAIPGITPEQVRL